MTCSHTIHFENKPYIYYIGQVSFPRLKFAFKFCLVQILIFILTDTFLFSWNYFQHCIFKHSEKLKKLYIEHQISTTYILKLIFIIFALSHIYLLEMVLLFLVISFYVISLLGI